MPSNPADEPIAEAPAPSEESAGAPPASEQVKGICIRLLSDVEVSKMVLKVGLRVMRLSGRLNLTGSSRTPGGPAGQTHRRWVVLYENTADVKLSLNSSPVPLKALLVLLMLLSCLTPVATRGGWTMMCPDGSVFDGESIEAMGAALSRQPSGVECSAGR